MAARDFLTLENTNKSEDNLVLRSGGNIYSHNEVQSYVDAAMTIVMRNRAGYQPHRILTAEEERGLKFLALGWPDIPLVPTSVEFEMKNLDGIAKAAADAFVVWNQALTVNTCRKMLPRSGLEFDDLQIAAMMGVIRAVEKWDPFQELKFSTYAMWWIRQTVSRLIADEGRLIRLPVHVHEELKDLEIFISQNPDLDENAIVQAGHEGRFKSIVGEEELRVRIRWFLAPVELRAAFETVDDWIHLSPDEVDNDVFILPEEQYSDDDAEETRTDGDAATDIVDVQDLEAIIMEQDLKKAIGAVLDTLSEREAGILKLRWGLEDGEMKTLDEIGRVYGLTRERIRQIESKAMSKLQDESRANFLWGHLYDGDSS